MSDQKNLIIAIAVSVAILLGFQFFVEKPRQDRLREQQATQQQATAGQSNAPAPSGGAKPGSAELPQLPSLAQQAAGQTLSREKALAETPRVKIEGKRLTGSINLLGARIDDIVLPEYKETIEPDSAPIHLLSPAGGPEPYYAEFGWTASGDGVALPNGQTRWTADKQVLRTNEPVTLTWDNGQGLVFTRVIKVDDNFMFTVTQKVENKGDKPVTLFPYALVSRHGTPTTAGLYILHEGPLGVFREKADDNGTLKEFSYKDLAGEKAQEFDSVGGWLGITDKYWEAALIPGLDQHVKARFSHVPAANGVAERYQVDYLGGGKQVEPGKSVETTGMLFAGAKEVKLIDRYEEELHIPRFDLSIDWGWFYFLTRPMFFTIDFFYHLIGNIGLAMLAVTVIVKVLFFPLAYKSYVSMSAMKKLQPEMQKLRERYADNREMMQKELMALYKKEKVNPAAGCLPIFLQIPVFFSLYKVLYITIEMRHAPFFGWIHDLSAPDPTSWINGFGLLPWAVPDLGPLHIVSLGVWPIIMGITMFLQMKMNPTPPDPVQAKIFTFMPIVFTFMLGRFAAGLVIYWSWNNTLSVLQQYVIMKRMGVKIGGGAEKPAPKPAK
ncbi:MAG TPA: membrane protein insertase YidC [Ferrovibrio sp.]|uniref:membrane protein insertase YidC n=1 Tax=Ferrovibrio sp. TaxID=1917215 RepID=UPI002ED64071